MPNRATKENHSGFVGKKPVAIAARRCPARSRPALSRSRRHRAPRVGGDQDHAEPERGDPEMGKDKFEPRMSFSHGRTKPVVVENIKRRIAAPTALLCPSCGAKMKLARSGGSPKLTASCPNCTK